MSASIFLLMNGCSVIRMENRYINEKENTIHVTFQTLNAGTIVGFQLTSFR